MPEGRAIEKQVQAQGHLDSRQEIRTNAKAMTESMPNDLQWPSRLQNATVSSYLLFSLFSWHVTCIESKRDVHCVGLDS